MCSGLKGGAREGSCRLSPGKTITWPSLAGEKAWVLEGICHVRTRRWPRHCSHEGEELGGSCRISTDKLPRGRGHHSSPELPKFFNFFFWIKGESRALAPTISNDWLEGLVNQRRIVWYCDSWEYECWDFASRICDYCDIADNITSHTNMARAWRDVRFVARFVCAGPCELFFLLFLLWNIIPPFVSAADHIYREDLVLLDAVWWSRGCALNEIPFKEKRWMMDDKCRLNYKRTGYLSDVLPQIVSRAWLNWFSHHPAAIDALCEQENKCVSSFVLCGFHLHMLLDLWLLLHRSGNSFSAQCRGCFVEWCFKFSFVREMAPVWQGGW